MSSLDSSALQHCTGFDWDEANLTHIAKHKVAPNEAEDIFFDKDKALYQDLKHSIKEERIIIIGKTRKGRLLYQVLTKRENKIRILSSRDINKKEVKLYEKST